MVFSVSGWWGAPRHSMQNILQHSTWRFDRIACHGWAECNKFCRRSFTRAMPHRTTQRFRFRSRPSEQVYGLAVPMTQGDKAYLHSQTKRSSNSTVVDVPELLLHIRRTNGRRWHEVLHKRIEHVSVSCGTMSSNMHSIN